MVESLEWTAEESVAVSEDSKSTSVFVTGKDQKLVPIKREEIVTGAETISTAPNPRRDESSVDRDK